MMRRFLDQISPIAWRERWRGALRRISTLEHRQRESEAILDILVSDAEFVASEDIGMNGQQVRKAIVRELFAHFGLRAAIETGTYLGATTGFLATEFGVPVKSCELMPRYYHAARRVLRQIANVTLANCDGRSLLRKLAGDEQVTGLPTFFYLDAHWYEDLPLLEELEIIGRAWRVYVVVIDDFRVPGDDGYGYDQYGQDKGLELSYLDSLIESLGMAVFFPRVPAAQESGSRRGCAVLIPLLLAESLSGSTLLRRHC